MDKVTLPPDLGNKFHSLRAPVEVCDAAGETLGRFLPEAEYHRLISTVADARFDRTLAERARADYRESGGMTTKELIAYLQSLEG